MRELTTYEVNHVSGGFISQIVSVAAMGVVTFAYLASVTVETVGYLYKLFRDECC